MSEVSDISHESTFTFYHPCWIINTMSNEITLIVPGPSPLAPAEETLELIDLGDGVYRPPFPKAVDSTMLKTWRGCRQKFFLEYMLHWKSKRPSIHLHAGKAFAAGLEAVRKAYWEGRNTLEDSLAIGGGVLIEEYATFEEPHDTAKTLPRMLGALDYYFEIWPLDSDPIKPWQWADGKYAIEFSFASPLPYDHPTTGEPVLYTGRSDFIGDMEGLWIVDDKTATQLGAQWQGQWDLRSQFTGYTWAAREVANIPVQGCIIRGVSILKTKYDHAQCITYRPAWQVNRWKYQVLQDLQWMEQAWRSGYYDYNLDEECNSYGGCLFKRICTTSPENQQAWLEADYEHRVWDPLKREERKVILLEQS